VLLTGVRVLSRVIVPLLVSELLGLSANGALCFVAFVEPQLLSKCSLILLSSTFCPQIGLYSRLEVSHYWTGDKARPSYDTPGDWRERQRQDERDGRARD